MDNDGINNTKTVKETSFQRSLRIEFEWPPKTFKVALVPKLTKASDTIGEGAAQDNRVILASNEHAD